MVLDVAMFAINVVAMVATVISCIIAIKAKNSVKVMVQEINTNSSKLDIKKNKGSITNKGTNSGVMAQNVGSVSIGDMEK